MIPPTQPVTAPIAMATNAGVPTSSALTVPATVTSANPNASNHSSVEWRDATSGATKCITVAVMREAYTYSGSTTQNTGTFRMTSRTVPPPTPVTTASHMNPITSRRLRAATSDPEIAKTTTAKISNQ